MAYITISGLPFCNAARYCEFLCSGTKLFSGSESPNRVSLDVMQLHRFAGHAILVGATVIAAIVLRPELGLLKLLVVAIVAFIVSTFFICLHANITEGLLISFITEEYLEMGSYSNVKRAPPGLLYEVRNAMVN